MGDETLLEHILNGDEEPKDLPLALLQSITNDFSDDRKIGQGGFGVVYKGVLRNGIIVAVKRMYVNENTVDDRSFRREINSLMKMNHQNVVRFLGFCSHAYHTSIKEAGSTDRNFINVRERLLCLEYINNGSLDKHITDELRGFEWKTRYEIIMGICKGLCYLHEETKIVHMDLKPANILLDDHMVPKITDFGLSRSNEMSHTTGQRFGTPGYIAPEYEKDGKTSFKCDIYSLGVIITELVTGRKSVPHKNNVLRRWRHRWNKPPTLLQYRQVTRCIEISVRCRQQESGHRPSILEMVNILGESESMDGHTGQESAYLDDDMLRIEPLELKLNEEMSWSVKLTNKTTASFAFNIERPSQQYTIWPDKGIVTPGCNEYLVQITLQPQQRASQVTQNADKIIFQSTKVPEGLRDEDITENIFHEEAGKVVEEVDLMIVYEPTKPKENCKSREDTNMPAKEVPEAKRREIVESAFGKGKLGSSETAEAASMAERIVGSLEDSTKDLIAKKTDVCQKIKNAEREGKKSTNDVDRWLEKVVKIIDVVHVISVECKLKKDVTMEASEKLREVQECLSICPSTVAIESMPPPVQEMPGPSMSTENHNLQDALQYIKDDPKVGMIGIWGPGGVGKTHLLNNINNSFGDGMTFDFVLFVTASRGCSVEKVQSQIIERLRLQSTGSNRLTIHEYMKTKSFPVLLDDLWNEINLEEVGIPYPLGNVKKLNRKVVLTTRLRKVCGQMKVKKELKVAYLQEHEAWQLFEENIGAETLCSPHIEALARELMKELKGLPLALITIGKAMYRKDEYQWETAIQYMQQSCCADDKDPVELGMETNVFKKLKFSYDNLRNKTLRDCFLTCALWPEDENISKDDLAQCWMGLGLVNEHDMESSFRKSYSLIADLKAACLLEGCEHDDIRSYFGEWVGSVKVHDVIRDMALWISCDLGKNNDKWIVAAPGGRDKKVIILSNEAECISLMSNRIPIRFNPDPIKLRILCLRNNKLDESIIVEAIKNCSSLTYLDLSGNNLKRIPEELCSLVKLEYLDLSENQFGETEVPHSFGKLINLKFLYLKFNGYVRIPAGVISSLKALQVIDLRTYIITEPYLSCLPEWIFRELGTLPQLKALGIMVVGSAQFMSLLGEAANLPIRYLSLPEDLGAFTRILSTDFGQRTLYELDIIGGDTREITVSYDTEQPNSHFGALNSLCLSYMRSLREIKWMGATPAFIFPRLTCLELFMCPDLSHFSWVMYLPRLEQLYIRFCDGMVQAFMRCHGDKLCNGQDKTKTFPCLKILCLLFNESLETIGDNGMEFPSLERLVVLDSPKLKSLPFQLDSLPLKLKELRFIDAQHWERLECEEGVKSFLQPALKFGYSHYMM